MSIRTIALALAGALITSAAQAGERAISDASRNGESLRGQISCASADRLSVRPVGWRFRSDDSTLDDTGAAAVSQLILYVQERVGGSWETVDSRVFTQDRLQYRGDLSRSRQILANWSTSFSEGCQGRTFRVQSQARFVDADGRRVFERQLRGDAVTFN